MTSDNKATKSNPEPSDWQLFTNNGVFNCVFPPSQRFSAKAKTVYKRSHTIIVPISQTKKPTQFTVAELLEKPKKPLPRADNVENFLVIWLQNENSKMKNIEASKNQLKQIASVVKTFTDADACSLFMDGIKEEKIFLIVSAKSGESLVDKTHQSKQVESIYLLSNETKFNAAWIKTIPEIRGIFNSMTTLCKKMSVDIRVLDHSLVGFEIISPNESGNNSKVNQQDASFMYDQLFREIVLTMNDESIEDIIDFGKSRYKNNEKESKFLESLKKEYAQRSAIFWYTEDSFLYRTLNKALRTHDYETLYALHVFIRHLHQALTEESKNRVTIPATLYRGQAMELDEFKQIQENKGGLMSVSCFFSTSSDREVSMKFAKENLKDQKKENVLIEITVEEKSTVPIVDIEKYSKFQYEKEWLFSMGAVFRIGSCERSPEGVWILKLTTTSDQDEQLKSLRDFLKKSMEDSNNCMNFARLMQQLGYWVKSEYFYQMAFQSESDWQRLAGLHNDLGTVKSQMGFNDKALDCYHRSLALREHHEPERKATRATLYNNIGTIYYEKSQKKEAKDFYQRALEAAQLQEPPNESLIATLYGNIASILNDEGKHQEALEKCQESLRIRKKIFPEIHPDVAWGYSSLASTYSRLGLFAEAVQCAEKAVEIDKKSLPNDHPQTKNHRNNLEIYKKRLNKQQNTSS